LRRQKDQKLAARCFARGRRGDSLRLLVSAAGEIYSGFLARVYP
jgi:hypothetical protein